MKRVIRVISKRPIRNTIISKDEITDIKILLNITNDVNGFLYFLEEKTGSMEKEKAFT